MPTLKLNGHLILQVMNVRANQILVDPADDSSILVNSSYQRPESLTTQRSTVNSHPPSRPHTDLRVIPNSQRSKCARLRDSKSVRVLLVLFDPVDQRYAGA